MLDVISLLLEVESGVPNYIDECYLAHQLELQLLVYIQF